MRNCPSKKVRLELWSHWSIWAEEGGGLTKGSREWSFGNGAVGFIGLPMKDGVFIEGMGIHCDTYPSQAKITVQCLDFRDTINAPVLCDISLKNSIDGGGVTNNARKVVMFDNAIEITSGSTIGFRTKALVGAVSDARVILFLKSDKQTITV